MNFIKRIKDYFDLNKPSKITTSVVEKPKPIQKKKEKKPFPYYRQICEYDETINHQCLACKEHFSTYYDTIPKFCLNCGIEFKGKWTKTNPRYHHYSKAQYPYIITYIKLYNRKNITKSKLDKSSFGSSVDTPVTEERLVFTKDKDSYYEWETFSYDHIIPVLKHKSSRIVLNDQRKLMKRYIKTNKLIQLWAGSKGKEKLIIEIVGDDEPYPVGYGEIRPSGFMTAFDVLCSG